MNALELYKYITEFEVEYHWQDNDGIDDVIIMPSIYHLQFFIQLLKPSDFEEGIEVILKDGYVCIFMDEICSSYGIELAEVFKTDKELSL